MNPRMTPDLAAELALAVAGASASSLDFVIVITGDGAGAPDRRVTERLGIDGLPVFRLTAGWAGALQGFYTARTLLAGGLERGLVIGPDGAAVVDADDCGPGCPLPARPPNESTELTGASVAYALPGSGGERR